MSATESHPLTSAAPYLEISRTKGVTRLGVIPTTHRAASLATDVMEGRNSPAALYVAGASRLIALSSAAICPS